MGDGVGVLVVGCLGVLMSGNGLLKGEEEEGKGGHAEA